MRQDMPVSLRDGELKRKDFYVTSSAPFAAYLMLRGYDLLGTFDEGITGPNGKPKLFFGLMPTDDELLNARQPLKAVETDIQDKFDEFENVYLEIPRGDHGKVNIRQYYLHTRTVFRSLDDAIRKPQR